MKKYIALVLALVCGLSMVSCSSAKDEVQWDLIPMVMVDGELYLDTGHNSSNIRKPNPPDGEITYEVDGEITSEVSGSEKPIIDNQSNFGTGYKYRYGSTEGTIEICMNDKWRIFATEEVRQ